jgi:hypothetical protein
VSVSKEDVAELTMKVFDRLEKQFPNAPVQDAILLVELSDLEDMQELDDDTGREAPATIVLMESTTDRSVIHEGILRFGLKLSWNDPMESIDDEDDED